MKVNKVRINTKPLKRFAEERLRPYPALYEVIMGIPDEMNPLEFVGWVGAIQKVMNYELSRECQEHRALEWRRGRA
jgi:hypothetical protein